MGGYFGDVWLPGAASTPWAWFDNDNYECDGGDHNPSECPAKGDWFMDPAWYFNWQFNWDDPVWTGYSFHPYLYNHLGGEISGTLRHFYIPIFPYQVKCDTYVLPAQSLFVSAGVTIKFDAGLQITSAGEMSSVGSVYSPIRFVRADNTSSGIKVTGEMKLKNRGAIKF